MMKKKLTLQFFLLTCSSPALMAQDEAAEPAPAKNMVKLNLPALALKNITLQYERALQKKLLLPELSG